MKTCTQHLINYHTRNVNSPSPNSILSQFSPGGLNNYNLGQGKTEDSQTGYSFPFQRRARSASPPKDPDVNEKIATLLSPKHTRENKTSAVDDLLEDQVMGLNPLKSINSIHSRMGSGGTKSRKPIVANTNLFFIGGSIGGFSNHGSIAEDKNTISTDKMKILSKAINHYLNGDYNKIMDNDEMPQEPNIIENEICTHDLRDHDVSDANENDVIDDGITNRRDVEDWLGDETLGSNPGDSSLEGKNDNGFDPFAQIPPNDYYQQRSSYKKRRSINGRSSKDTSEASSLPTKQTIEKKLSNENIMKIIQDSQRPEETTSSTNQKYLSLSSPKDTQPIEK